jgi:hypothetical protein
LILLFQSALKAQHVSSGINKQLFFIQSHHQHSQLITEQNPGEQNPLIQLGIETIHSSDDYLINTSSQDT